MKRPLTLTLALLALAPGCSAKKSAPKSDAVPEAPAKDGGAPEDADAIGAAAPAEPEPASPAPAESSVKAARELEDESDSKRKPASPPSAQADALAGSRVELAEPMINGGLNRDIIRRKAQDHEDDIRACHARSLVGDPDLAGTVAVELSVDERGVVRDVELADATDLADEDTVDCILELVSGWSFAGEATAKASVELRFDLTVAD